VNPKARIRPVHRPPRPRGDSAGRQAGAAPPAGRVPVCRWEVVIDDDTQVLPEADVTRLTRTTTAATYEFPPMRDGTPHIPGPPD